MTVDSLFPMGNFVAGKETVEEPTFNPEIIPKEMDIFFKSESDFLPEGKTSFDELTPDELRELQNKYRFSPYRPGIYQSITGMGKMAL